VKGFYRRTLARLMVRLFMKGDFRRDYQEISPYMLVMDNATKLKFINHCFALVKEHSGKADSQLTGALGFAYASARRCLPHIQPELVKTAKFLTGTELVFLCANCATHNSLWCNPEAGEFAPPTVHCKACHYAKYLAYDHFFKQFCKPLEI